MDGTTGRAAKHEPLKSSRRLEVDWPEREGSGLPLLEGKGAGGEENFGVSISERRRVVSTVEEYSGVL